MENSQKKLRELGWILIIFAIYDVFEVVLKSVVEIANGEVTKVYATVAPELLSVVNVVLGVVAGLWALLNVAQIFIGVRGLQLAKGKVIKSTAHIKLAKLLGVLNVLGVIALVVNLFSAKFDVSTLLAIIITLCDVYFMFAYAKEAKNVREAA